MYYFVRSDPQVFTFL